MKGVQLRLYTYENRKHHGLPIYEWLLRQLGIHGGSAYKAIAGYGRHGRLHEQHFFELAGEEPILVEFIVTREQARLFLGSIAAEQLQPFYARLPAEFGEVGAAGCDFDLGTPHDG